MKDSRALLIKRSAYCMAALGAVLIIAGLTRMGFFSTELRVPPEVIFGSSLLVFSYVLRPSKNADLTPSQDS